MSEQVSEQVSEEEKKELNRVEERLKELSKCELFLDNIFIKDKTARQILVSAYNKLERQQKQIKIEKNHNTELAIMLDEQENEIKKLEEELEIEEGCSISKSKIREKIEHYNNELEHIKNGEEFENEKPMYYWGKVALEELLEEN